MSLTTKAAPQRGIMKDIDGRQWGISQVGNIYFHWHHDSSGNPIKRNPQDGNLYYVNWDSVNHKWEWKELFSIASRKAFLKQVYFPPSAEEQSYVISRMFDPSTRQLQYDPIKMVRHPARSQSKVAGASSLKATAPVTAMADSNTPPPAGSIKRPLLLIYVKFNNSTGTEIPDSTILKWMTDKDTFGTIAHYFYQNFRGAVELSAINNKVYHVTLQRPAYQYFAGGFGASDDAERFNQEVMYEAIKDVVTTQGVDLLSLSTEDVVDTFDPGYSTQSNPPTPIVFHGKKVLDPAVVTPIILVHGQDTAASGIDTVGAIANEASVWGHASPNMCTIGWDAEGNFVCEANNQNYYHDLDKGIYYDEDGNVAVDSYYATRIGSCATFGLFHGSHECTIGVMTHELGHALFYLPDLYDVQTPDRTGDSADDDIMGMGAWSLMAYNWTYKQGEYPGSCPPNLDGYCLHYFNRRFCKPVFSSGAQVISDVFTPHVVIDPDNEDEVFILQLRCFKDYDEGIAPLWKTNNGTPADGLPNVSKWGQTYDAQADQVQPGVLIEHVNSKLRLDKGDRQLGILNVSSSPSLPYSLLLGGVLEAHGGTQHLRTNVKTTSEGATDPSVYGMFNAGDRQDLYGVFSHNSFGQNTDPDTTYWTKSGKAQFDITDITVDATACTASYNITFATEGVDPEWDLLPMDPLRPNATTEPEEPTPPPVEVACARPRLWRFRDMKTAVPVGFVQHW